MKTKVVQSMSERERKVWVHSNPPKSILCCYKRESESEEAGVAGDLQARVTRIVSRGKWEGAAHEVARQE